MSGNETQVSGRMVVLVSGSRDWDDDNAIEAVLEELQALPKHAIVVHGDCRGIDKVADATARMLGLEVRSYPANWRRFDRLAGRIRNVEMFDKERPDLFLGFHEDIKRSKGTKHAYNLARSRGIPAKIIGPRDDLVPSGGFDKGFVNSKGR